MVNSEKFEENYLIVVFVYVYVDRTLGGQGCLHIYFERKKLQQNGTCIPQIQFEVKTGFFEREKIRQMTHCLSSHGHWRPNQSKRNISISTKVSKYCGKSHTLNGQVYFKSSLPSFPTFSDIHLARIPHQKWVGISKCEVAKRKWGFIMYRVVIINMDFPQIEKEKQINFLPSTSIVEMGRFMEKKALKKSLLFIYASKCKAIVHISPPPYLAAKN